MADEGDVELDDGEMRKILALAATVKKTSTKVTLRDLQASAADVGISAEAVQNAFLQLRHERRRRRFWGGFALLAAATIALVVWWTRPVPFSGESTVRLSTALKDNAPVDAITTLKLFTRRDFYVYVDMVGARQDHKVRCDLVAKRDGKRIWRGLIQLQNPKDNHWFWFEAHVPWDTPAGDYEAQVFVDDRLVNEEPLQIIAGNARMTTARVLEKGMNPAPLVTSFSREKDKQAYARVDWDDLRGSDLDVEFRWLDSAGTEVRRMALVITKSEGSHWAWDPLDLTTVQDGAYKVIGSVEGIVAAETTFTVGP